jgi:hypothetical protein
MPSLARRDFLAASLGGMAALGGGLALSAKDSDKKSSSKSSEHKSLPSSGGELDTLFLTWQRDPTTTMTIQWVGPATGATTKIEYAVDKHDAWGSTAAVERPYHPESDLRVHRAELTGLKPGTEYRFRIGSHSAESRFRTMPAKATDAFQFISGGDAGANEHVTANNILAARQDPMFVLIGGDLAYDDGHKIDANLGFLRSYSRHMIDNQGRMIPMVACIGNHEVKGGYGKTRSDAPLFFALHDGLFAERSFAKLDFGDYLSLVLLDTGHVAPIDGEQTAWLGQTLRERVGRPHLIVANHVPAYPSYRSFESNGEKEGTGLLNRTEWAPLFERHLVDVVLEHHDHTFKRTHPLLDGRVDKNGIIYLGDGSWGKLRPPKNPEERPYLAATNGAYHMTLHRLEGERRFHLALADTGQIVDICITAKRLRRPMGRSG